VYGIPDIMVELLKGDVLGDFRFVEISGLWRSLEISGDLWRSLAIRGKSPRDRPFFG
jgi:hypothetical protein